MARNHALKECKGKYITFLDGDDELYKGSVQAVIDAVSENNNFDIMYCRGFRRIPNKTGLQETHPWKHLFNEDTCYTDQDLAKQKFINGGSVCGGIFRKDFFMQNQLLFAEGVANGEDTIFTYLMYARHPRIIFKDIKLNVINVREGSATHDCTIERVKKFEKNILYLLQQRVLHNDTSIFDAIDKSIYHSIMLAIDMYLNVKKKKSCKELYDILHISEISPLQIIHPPFHQRVKILLLEHNFWLCLKFIQCENWKNKFIKKIIIRG